MKNLKKLILIFLIIIVLILIAVLIVKAIPNKNDDLKEVQNKEFEVDNSIKIDGTKKVDDIEINNIKIKLIGENHCEVTADVKNNTENTYDSKNIELRAIDSEGKVFEIFGGVIKGLKPNEERVFKTYILSDITKAKDIEFEEIGGEELNEETID